MPWTIRLRKFRIHSGFFILVFIAFIFDFWRDALVIYLFAALHEGAHIITARLCGIGIEEVELLPFGLCGKLQGDTFGSSRNEILIASAGPAVNLILLLTLPQNPLWIAANLSVLLLNLMPALPLDGGRVLRAILVEHCGCLQAQRLMKILSLATASLLILAGIVILWMTHFNFFLLLIGCFVVTGWLAEEKAGQTVYLKELLYSRNRLEREGNKKSYLLTLEENQPARLALSHISYNRYTWIYIADKQGNLKGIVSETELIRFLLGGNPHITAGEILRLDKKRKI